MFRSFFLAGFECATGYNRHRNWIDQVAATQHDQFLNEDYDRLNAIGIHSVREGLRWPLIDRRGSYDLSYLKHIVDGAREKHMEVIYDLFHYGYPADADIYSPEFADRFAEYCYTVAKYVSANSDGPYYFTPVNEPSYFSWAGGEMGLFAPHSIGRGDELKYALVRAAIQGINAIWSVAPHAKIVTIDPICHVVPATPDERAAADNFNERVVFQSLDMLSGRWHPELGGSPEHLGTIGINYYWKNQWVLGGDTLAEHDPRRVALRSIVRKVHERYHRDLFISETAHVDERRASWVSYVAEEMIALIEEGLPVHGICLYPILGMPEWHYPEQWARMGLWDLVLQEEAGHLERHIHIPMFDALVEAQHRVARVQRLKSHSLEEQVLADIARAA